jgi:hypothetical protein
VERRLRLDRHRQILGNALDGPDVDELPDERPDRQLDIDPLTDLG